MRVLLTGSSGWLGWHLAPALREAGHEIVGLDVMPGPETDVVGSVADRALVDRVFIENAIEAVVHCGALHKPDIIKHSAQAFVDVNVTGTLNLLEAAARAGHPQRRRHREGGGRGGFDGSSGGGGDSGGGGGVEAYKAVWLRENCGQLEPRNIYGITKLAAEQLCRLAAAAKPCSDGSGAKQRLCVAVLRTSRFFPEDDDSDGRLGGENMKAVELLHRRLTVADACAAHVAALAKAPGLPGGFGCFIISAPTPFKEADCCDLKLDAASVVARYFPDAPALFAARGWSLPASIGRVYDASHAERVLGFRCATDFASILNALLSGEALPFTHDATCARPAAAATAAADTASADDDLALCARRRALDAQHAAALASPLAARLTRTLEAFYAAHCPANIANVSALVSRVVGGPNAILGRVAGRPKKLVLHGPPNRGPPDKLDVVEFF